TDTNTLSLHDALPILAVRRSNRSFSIDTARAFSRTGTGAIHSNSASPLQRKGTTFVGPRSPPSTANSFISDAPHRRDSAPSRTRSEEHTSELQSRRDL